MPATEPTIKIVSPSDLVNQKYARWSWYGDQGIGKSSLAASVAHAPDVQRTLVVRIEGENMDPYEPFKDRIKIVTVYRWDQLAEILILLRSAQNPFQAVIFDTWPSRLAIMKIAGIDLTEEEAIDLIRNPHKLTVTPQKGQDTRTLWGDIASLQYTTYMTFAELPVHLVLLFQPEEREKNGEVHMGPALTPATAVLLRPQLKMCGYLFPAPNELTTDVREISTERRARRMLIEKHDFYFTKGPAHSLGAVVKNPTWNKLAKSLAASPLEIEEEE